ncbi:MAG: ATP-binding protein, partial [Pseudonocardiaceae bacterium]
QTSPGRGAGLGLSIVRSVARAHHGEVHAHSRPDGGLRVHVRIPTKTPPATEHANEDAAPRSRS